MREIKFRGKTTDEVGDRKIWIYGDLLQGCEICDICEISDCESIDGTRYQVEQNSIGQYTGLKDKNGKEVYEGDILRNIYYQYSNDEVSNKGFKEEILKVVYRGCGFIFEKIKINEIEMPEDFKEELIEVIGNIYENPDLLKESDIK